MSQWQFTLIDYTTSPNAPISTIIDEPVGWDAVNLHLKRDDKWHGFFSFEDDSFSSLQYDEDGATILRNAYYNYGVNAKVLLSVNYECDNEKPEQNIYLAQFDFTTFNDIVSDRCYVECAVYLAKSVYQFKNRNDQQVDLDSLASYDQLPTQQTIKCQAEFQTGTNLIRVGVLLNGLPPGSKITITGAANPANNGTFYVASAKPDYTNVNPDLQGGNTVSSLQLSGTFNPLNNTISINQAVNIAVGANITVSGTPNIIDGNGPYYWNNDGVYIVQSVAQFFGYTIITVRVQSITDGSANCLNGPANQPNTPYFVAGSFDSVIFQATFQTSQLPTATIIQIPLQPVTLVNEIVNITLVGEWLINNLNSYTGLGEIITVPSKEIQAESLWETYEDLIFGLIPNGAVGGAGVPFNSTVAITPEIQDVIDDIQQTNVGTGVPIYTGVGITNSPFNNINASPPNTPPDTSIYFSAGSLACSGIGTLKIKLNYQFLSPAGDPGPWSKYASSVAQLVIATGNDPYTMQQQGGATIIASIPLNWYTSAPPPIQNITREIDNIIFPPGTYLWVYIILSVANVNDGWCPELLIGSGTQMSFIINSECTDTPCAVYFVNEALSRCAESYTNGAIRVYSDYFGRLNSQPYAAKLDGCGALRCITNGVRIRGCIMPDGSAIPKFFTSLDEMFTALDTIDNIGMGLEADTNRTGYYRLRVEKFQYFFQNNILLTCNNVFKIERNTQSSLLPSIFEVGYQAFETWNNNGLYDIFGKRTYRTPLTSLQNTLSKVCKWMASDYAIEFTRRQFGASTIDSRYDASTFIMCLKNSYNAPVELVQGCVMVMTNQSAAVFFVGQAVEISGAVNGGNNGTFTVNNIIQSKAPSYQSSPSSYLAFVYFSGFSPINEFNSAIKFKNTFTSQFEIIQAYFIGVIGAVVLDELPLYNAQQGDNLLLTNNQFTNLAFSIGQIFSPQLASQPGVIPQSFFPMLIFPTAFPPGITYDYWATTKIVNLQNQFYTVEQGVENGTNILNPDTVMNYRISPAHNALRHLINVLADRNFINQTLIFTGGDGNFYALGEISDSCSPENGNISEGGDIAWANLQDASKFYPLFYAETIKFEYPLSWSDFMRINNNPYGLIKWNHDGVTNYSGWLVNLEYNPYKGMATFTIYPKVNLAA